MPSFASIAKAGVAGCCSIYLLIFGFMLLIPGIFFGSGNFHQSGGSSNHQITRKKFHDDAFDDPFFKQSNDIFNQQIERQNDFFEEFDR